MFIGEYKNVKVKFYPEDASKEALSTVDQFSSNKLQSEEKNTSNVSESNATSDSKVTNVVQSSEKKLPIISEIIHVKSY